MREFFDNVSAIEYKGPKSKNPLSFRYYDPEERIGDKKMKDHLRFAVAFWHTFGFRGADLFGSENMIRPWDNFTDPMDRAKAKMDAAFEFFEKLGVHFFCFHDRDISPEGETLRETNKNLDEITKYIKHLMNGSDVKCLWGTANLFKDPVYIHGAATSCNADVFAHAAAQVKKAMEVTLELGGQNFVFWGGREGYEILLNTDMKFELDNYARFLHMAVEYAREIGFTGQLLIEPKPKEPMKHQYDFDVATTLAFLKNYDLDKYFKLNIEANHATLAAHTFQHELRYARINDKLGSIDVNQGDPLLGWDVDRFPTDVYSTTLAMYEVLKNGGIEPGGLNFDAKVRRPSFELVDLFYAHIAGMDAYAKGLKIAYRLLKDKVLENFIEERYASYRNGIGLKIVNEEMNFKDLEKYALGHDHIRNSSGRQEMLEAALNEYVFEQQ